MIKLKVTVTKKLQTKLLSVETFILYFKEVAKKSKVNLKTVRYIVG